MKKQLRTYPKPYIYTLYSPHAPHEALLFYKRDRRKQQSR